MACLTTPIWPTEDEDSNGNGVLDPGEDGLIGAPNGKLDKMDYNHDGIFTVRQHWDLGRFARRVCLI